MKKTVYKRRREGKTDYKVRMGMLKGGTPRVVVRKSNKYIYVQYVESKEAKDKPIFGISSKRLIDEGWPKEASGSLKSIPAAYLTGYLAGKKIIEKRKKEKVILDIGLSRNVKGSRVYAVLKGLVDAGVNIAYNEKVFPEESRIEGKHMKINIQEAIKKIISKIK
ncbi:MAG: 50S ribosomal protein L18 [Candidatus Pacearchaeota archaeon]